MRLGETAICGSEVRTDWQSGLGGRFPRDKLFPTARRIPVWPFVVVVKAGQRTPPEGLFTGEDMPQYLAAIRKLRPVCGR